VLKESFLNLTGKGVSEQILQLLTQWGLEFIKLRGYDGTASMAGKNGVQAVVSRQYPLAVYVHCACHCLNLTLSSSSNISTVRANENNSRMHNIHTFWP